LFSALLVRKAFHFEQNSDALAAAGVGMRLLVPAVSNEWTARSPTIMHDSAALQGQGASAPSITRSSILQQQQQQQQQCDADA
jgi:hypothetical protein